jgi:hypothetical protein
MRRSFLICSVPLTKYHLGDQIKKNEMGGACNTYGASRGALRVSEGNFEERRPLGR